METVETQTTLRDTLSAAFDEHSEPRQSTIGAEVTQATEAEERAQRARDEAGRFAKEDKANKLETVAAPQVPPSAGAATPASSPVPRAVAPVQRPSSWKKDYWADYDKIAAENPKLAEYLNQREREFATGVSAYKSEAENARQLNEAIAPFLPNLQKHNLEPTQWIRALGNAHERLALGSPQEKVQTFATLMNQYGVNPQHLFQMLSGQQPQFSAQPMAAQQQPDIERIVEAKLTEKEINSEYQRFLSEAPEKYPHFDAVKETMAGLLQAELAQDYKSAYEAAIRHPRHADIFNAVQEQEREANAAAEREKLQAATNSAKRRQVSMPSATPSASKAKTNGTNSLRDTLSEAFDNVTSSRV